MLVGTPARSAVAAISGSAPMTQRSGLTCTAACTAMTGSKRRFCYTRPDPVGAAEAASREQASAGLMSCLAARLLLASSSAANLAACPWIDTATTAHHVEPRTVALRADLTGSGQAARAGCRDGRAR